MYMLIPCTQLILLRVSWIRPIDQFQFKTVKLRILLDVMVRRLRRGLSYSKSRSLPTQDSTTHTNASSGIRTHSNSVRAV